MKTLYIECGMGAAGDMLAAALYEITDLKDEFINKMNSLRLGVTVSAEPSVKRGILGTRLVVRINGEEEGEHNNHNENHCHSHDGANFSDINGILSSLQVSERVKNDAANVYKIIADAESGAHGRPVDQIHFHELGNLDAVADIVGVSLLIEMISPEKIIASPICTGSGFVRCAHGLLPVPAPATARILFGVPTYAGEFKSELCTPTGAALLKYFAGSFGAAPLMSVQKTGYGMGKKDFEAANCVRVFLCDEGEKFGSPNNSVAELKCNIDDMTAEQIGFAARALMKAGALDVFTSAVQMKKDRPGTLITCVCEVECADAFAALMMKLTSTFGVRKSVCERYTLERETEAIETAFGEVSVKKGAGYGVNKSKLEYVDVARVADEKNISYDDAESLILTQMNERPLFADAAVKS